jgi:hypothetical protein
MIDSAFPAGRDCNGYTVTVEGTSPHIQATSTFFYDDGCVRTFDGKNWAVLIPSREAQAKGAPADMIERSKRLGELSVARFRHV